MIQELRRIRGRRRIGHRQFVCLVVLGCLSLGAGSDPSISPSVASLFVGDEKIVEGTVTAAERDGNTVRLRLGSPPKSLTVSLVVGLLSNFPPEPERYYTGKTVRVAGTIRSFRGAAEIVIHDAADIQLADAAAAPAANRPAGSAAEESTVQQRVEALTERVRLLEEHVQQLERTTPRGADR